MVQLQVACHIKKCQKTPSSSSSLTDPNKDDCDIISELLFHNDGARDTINHNLSQAMSPLNSSTVNKSVSGNYLGCDEEEVLVKSNTVMFEYREQFDNVTRDTNCGGGPFSSFFDNDCDIFEQVSIIAGKMLWSLLCILCLNYIVLYSVASMCFLLGR